MWLWQHHLPGEESSTPLPEPLRHVQKNMLSCSAFACQAPTQTPHTGQTRTFLSYYHKIPNPKSWEGLSYLRYLSAAQMEQGIKYCFFRPFLHTIACDHSHTSFPNFIGYASVNSIVGLIRTTSSIHLLTVGKCILSTVMSMSHDWKLNS